jgi:hypothetical protein
MRGEGAMADGGDAKSPLLRVQAFLRDGFIPHERDNSVHVGFRAFTKWYFDLLKNIIAVGALMALAKKTHSVLIYAMGLVSFSILVTYVASHMRWRFNASIIFRVIIASVFMIVVQYVLITAISAIVDSNTK